MKKTKHPPTRAPLHLFGAHSEPWLGEPMAPGTAQRKRRKILRRTGRGMTVVEVLIGLVILGIVFGSLFSKACLSGQNSEQAERAAVQTMRKLRPTAKEVSAQCQGVDTNSDGYVTCTVSLDGQFISLDCPTLIQIGNSGCKISRGQIFPALPSN
jgi:type II secretory pathway pseudopilin PulG